MNCKRGRVLSRCLLLALLAGSGMVLFNASPGVAEEYGVDPGWREFEEGELADVDVGVEIKTTFPTVFGGAILHYRYNVHNVPPGCVVLSKIEVWLWPAETPDPLPAMAPGGVRVYDSAFQPTPGDHAVGYGTFVVPAGLPSGTLVEIRFCTTCIVHKKTKTCSTYYRVR